jgi:hypothetical protein
VIEIDRLRGWVHAGDRWEIDFDIDHDFDGAPLRRP